MTLQRGVSGHRAISASAGSGKTFQLAHRYLELLAAGAGPEEIVALTFSRKAAGEIFDSVVKYLCEAAVSEPEAHALAERIHSPGLTRGGCTALLRTLLNSLHRLRVGTLDSFTVSILRSFPMELGIPPGFELIDSEGATAATMRQRILDSILREGHAAQQVRQEFLSAFSQANAGRLDKQVQDSLAEFITSYQSHIRALPDAERWGQKRIIWPGGSPWLDDPAHVEQSASELLRLLPDLELPDEASRRWDEFIASARNYSIHSRWSNDIGYLFRKLAECLRDLRSGSATVKLNRKACILTGDVAGHVLTLVAHIVRTDLQASLLRTQGIHGLLTTYERHYDEAMRRDGTISFTDAQHLLTGSGEYPSAVLSSMSGESSRLYIDYRLDARLNHWLLDEFQDTSDLQWQVLENLIDEVLQDDSGERTFFYVGDVKQAIYGWRGGNPRLFDVPLTRYPGKIQEAPLNESYRSCPPIIDMVNEVFGDLNAPELPPLAIARWQRYWATHQSAPTVRATTGFATVLEPLCSGGTVTPTPEDRYSVVAHLLNEMKPLARGLSTAVLVRSNEQGRAVVDCLRTECPEMTVIHEGRAAIKDNPVVAVLLALVTYAAHPGDRLAWRHLQMSPLHDVFAQRGLSREDVAPHVLRRIQAHGFQRTLRDWASELATQHPLDDFGRLRLEQLLAAAGELDAGGGANCDDFLAHIEHYELHDSAANDAIRVMTVHQAKGLGFDVVILPELDKHSMVRARDLSFILSREPATQKPQWALEIPRRDVAECDDILRSEIEEVDASTAFESLCLLYVAITRAKRGLYVITSYPGKNSTVFNQSALVKLQLVRDAKATENQGTPVTLAGGTFTRLYARGDERWFAECPLTEHPVRPAAHVTATPRERVLLPSPRARLVAIRPSDAEVLETNAADLFHPDRQQRMETGIAVHALLQLVTWSDGLDIEALVTQWGADTDADADTKIRAIDHVHRALASPRVLATLKRPKGNVALWRERRFDVVVDDRWITGSFDRVVIEQDAGGAPAAATIYDFKTDEILASRVAQHASLYREQLTLYREALARILRLPPPRIRMVLIFTAPGAVYEFPAK
jgi:ATP-dependent helicase/nuclease subunit A